MSAAAPILERPLPGALPPATGSAALVEGRGQVREVRVDGAAQPTTALGERFWSVVELPPRSGPDPLRVQADATELGEVPVAQPQLPEPLRPRPQSSDAPLLCVCMATFEPDPELFRAQIASLREQTDRAWVCVISDDGSSPEHRAAIEAELAGDERFAISPAPERRGFYRNFERALRLAHPDAALIALADQDDRWHPDKLAALRAAIGGGALAFCDLRYVDAGGQVLRSTLWKGRRVNHTSLVSMLVANTVTGAATLLRADVARLALPFPDYPGFQFHDHWLALVALALGDIAYVPRPLYDYVQHDAASLGHAEANRMIALRDRVRSLRRSPRERARDWRLHYFVDACRLMQAATILELRCGERMAAGKRRALRRFMRAERSPASIARLGVRGARELLGHPETLGAEWMLFHAFTWRRLVDATVRDRPTRRLRLDAVPPPSFAPRPGSEAATVVADKIAPLELARSAAAPPRINLLIPTIDLDHFFGGYIAMFNLARRLAEHGARVRIVTVDPVGPLPRDWRAQVESYGGLAGVFDRLEVAFGRETPGLEVSPSDRFIATTWWTAHIARAAAQARFLYVIQEHEPFTFPMGTFAALADQSYRLPQFALYSTELLREYHRRHGIGAASDSASFENAITPVTPAIDLAERRPRRLLFYARPEPHAARNMFELGILALQRALADGAFRDGWELRGIGTVAGGREIALGGGATLELLPRVDQDAYADVLREHDVGLALMYTPHPSLVPIEMSAAGMLTVTNSFDTKTPETLAAISSNLVVAEPTIEAVAAALGEAAAGVEDVERRLRGSVVRWSRDWDESFDDALIDRVSAFLDACAA